MHFYEVLNLGFEALLQISSVRIATVMSTTLGVVGDFSLMYNHRMNIA